jgi:diguanylate cyclase (GGDEF)-like protein
LRAAAERVIVSQTETAMPDKLTGLRTHRDDLRDEIKAHGQSCCLVDIDGLIWVNDQEGHVEGDRVLVAVATRLEETVSAKSACVFRVGGDEFLVLFPSLNRAGLHEIAARIVSDIRALKIRYRRTDCPARAVVEVNVALLSVTPTFTARALDNYGLAQEARDWVADGVYREQQQSRCPAGVVVDLLDAADCPWVG